MINLKNILLLIAFCTILSTLFAGEVSAGICSNTKDGWKCPLPKFENTTYGTENYCNSVCIGVGTCSSSGDSWKCSLPGFEKTTYPSQEFCNSVCTINPSSTPTPTRTPTPIPTGNCGNQNCSSNQTCIGIETSFDNSTFCLTKGIGGIGSYCGTPNKTPNSDACSSGFCGSDLRCTTGPTQCATQGGQCTAVNVACNSLGNYVPGGYKGSYCPDSAPQCCVPSKPVWKQITVCSVSANIPTRTPTPPSTNTPTATPTPNLFTCTNQIGGAAGNYQCATIINGAVQCPADYGVFSQDDSKYAGTSCGANQGCCKQGSIPQPNLFTCQNQTTGTYAGNYTCADIVNGATQCPDGYSNYNESAPYTGTSCGTTRGCCKQNAPTPTRIPTGTPTPTPTITPTPLPGSVQLAMNISVPRMIGKQTGENNSPILRNNRPVTVILKSAIGQTIDKSGTLNYSQQTGSYTGTVDLGTSIPSGAYKVVVKMDNHLKGFVQNLFLPITTSTISVPLNASLIVGVDDDNNPSPTFYYKKLHECFGSTIDKSKCSTPQEADLNSDGAVDPTDYSIFIRRNVTSTVGI